MSKELEESLRENPLDESFFKVMEEMGNLKKGESKELECPKCKKKLFIARNEYNGHMFAKCETDNCIWIMQ